LTVVPVRALPPLNKPSLHMILTDDPSADVAILNGESGAYAV